MKVAGFGIQQGTKILGGAVSTVQGLTGSGGGEAQQEERQPEQRQSRAQQQRQRQQKAASQRRSSQQPKELDDVSITRKVETEIFRSTSVDKGKIDVNTADGTVWLRGQAKNPEQIKELEAKASAIPEVKRVENLLHLPGTPAPTRTDTPPTQRKTRRSKAAPAARKVTPARTTSERRAPMPSKEPSPADLASTGSGRQPPKLGSEGEGGDSGSGNGGSPAES